LTALVGASGLGTPLAHAAEYPTFGGAAAGEGTFDFDTPYNRVGTGSSKWDGVMAQYPGETILNGMGTADLDFRAAPCITKAIAEQSKTENWGYYTIPDKLYTAIVAALKEPKLREYFIAGGYEPRGVWIRQRKTPLTHEQNECLTAFAMRQDGKWFALPRLGRQLTPFRTRGPLRTYWMGQPHGGDRRSYFCSELVTESLVAAGLVDPAKARPGAPLEGQPLQSLRAL
jgi:hypothetical protein